MTERCPEADHGVQPAEEWTFFCGDGIMQGRPDSGTMEREGSAELRQSPGRAGPVS